MIGFGSPSPEPRGLLPENTCLVEEGTHSAHTQEVARFDKIQTGHFLPEEAIGSGHSGKSSTQWKLGMLHWDM